MVAPSLAAPLVQSVRVGDYPAKTRFVLDLTAPVRFDVFTLANPYRVVIDLPEVGWKIRPGSAPRSRLIRGYRLGLFQPGNSRVVIDVARPVVVAKAFLLPPGDKRAHRLVIDLKPVSRSAFRSGKPATRKTAIVLTPPLPRALRGKPTDSRPLIAIDPGHGGIDPGAHGSRGVWEKDITLAQARELRRQLRRSGRYRVVMTRNRDIFVRLRNRIAIAQRAGADLFISLHADSIGNSKVRGGSVYTLSERASDREAAALAAKENRADIIAGIDLNHQSKTVARILIDLRQRLNKNESVKLAKAVTRELSKKMRLLRNNHRFAGFAVLKAPDIPSILIETGYLSNPSDERMLTSPKHRRGLAAALVAAIDVHFARQQAYRKP
ncbi:MAG: N-acetylmuramoyl-L-alanine amidase [Alphaproteobacteria bacterium]